MNAHNIVFINKSIQTMRIWSKAPLPFIRPHFPKIKMYIMAAADNWYTICFAAALQDSESWIGHDWRQCSLSQSSGWKLRQNHVTAVSSSMPFVALFPFASSSPSHKLCQQTQPNVVRTQYKLHLYFSAVIN